MTQLTLLPQTGVTGTIGTQALIGASSVVNMQFNPQNNVGFSGTLSIDGSTAGNPGATDWYQLANIVFSAQTSNFDINMYLTNVPWVRARIVTGSLGTVAVYAAY